MASTADSDRVKEIFYEAATRAEETRAEFLDRACHADLALRSRVEALLLAHDRAGQFMEEPTTHPDATPAPADIEPGDEIGPYTLVRRLGEGGFGDVFLARQLEPLDRLVALKVLKPGMDSRHIIARFEIERRTLAIMDHPCIAKVIDAGTTPGGRPFVAMEYVDGSHVTDYCNSESLPVEERLVIFAQICLAVQHAHQKGIIHRDLKPSNILVTQLDGKPTPKVIDFGIAKAVAGEVPGASQVTFGRQLLGTPEYMSPEQAAGASDDLDTRSDVYSLGVLLYELLCGVPPFDRERLRTAGPAELERILREDEPLRPSARFASLDEGTQHGVAARRRTEPARLRRAMQGDLDWIVMCAIEKAPERRYPTANALAIDVRRHLADQPIEAGRPSAVYTARKFLRRHRAGALAAATAALAIVVALVVSTISLYRVADAAQRAEVARKMTEHQLWQSYLAQARATRQGTAPGRRFDSLMALSAASLIQPSIELRNEAIAALGLADVKPTRSWADHPQASSRGLAAIDRFVYVPRPGEICVASTDDGRDMAVFHVPGASDLMFRFSPDGKYLAAKLVADFQIKLLVWDVDSRELVLTIDHRSFQSDAIAMGINADVGHWLAYPGVDNMIRVVELPSGEPLASLPVEQGWKSMSADAAGERLAVTTYTAEIIQIYDLRTASLIKTLEPPSSIWSVDWSADGRFLAGGAEDFGVYVWNTDDWTLHAQLDGHQGQVTFVDFASTGAILATSGWDNTIRLWDAERATPLVGPIQNWSLIGFADQLAGVRSATVALWHVETGDEVIRIETPDRLGVRAHVAVDSVARLLATAGADGVIIWDVDTGRHVLTVVDKEATGVFFVHERASIMALLNDGLHSWSIRNDAGALSLGPDQVVWEGAGDMRMTEIKDSSTIAIAGPQGLDLVDVHSGEQRAHLDPFPGIATDPSVTSDLRYAFCGNWKGPKAIVREITTGDTVLEIPADHVTGAFSPDDSRLVVGTGRDYVCYSTADWSVLWRYARDNSDELAGDLRFTSDSRIVALARSRFALDLVDATNGHLLAALESPEHQAISDIIFTNNDGAMVVCSTGTVAQVYDLTSIRRQLAEMDLDWDL